jgi:hypothetical protein
MGILQQLAGQLARKHRGEGVSLSGFAETLTDVRRLLGHEVDFAGEQSTLPEAARIYGSIPGFRHSVRGLVPRRPARRKSALRQAASRRRDPRLGLN